MWETKCTLATSLALSAILAAGCGDDGASTGTAGVMAGSVAGAAAGTVAGTAAGTVAGTAAGTTAGAAAGTMAGMSSEMDPCAMDSGLTGAALHNEVLSFVTMVPGSCNASSCHDSAGPPRAGLMLQGMTDLSTLVGMPSCEVPTIPLVTAGQPEQSWLWLKVWGASVDLSGILTEDPAWGTIQACGQDPGATFGVRMPKGIGMGSVSMERLVQICDWIQAGATGP